MGAEKVFSEQASSVAQRAKLAECLAFLREGDVPFSCEKNTYPT